MSDGARVPLDRARRIAEALVERWDLTGLRPDHTPECLVVGSVRRQSPEVGDLEIIAPLPERLTGKPTAADDPLFSRINAAMENPWSDDRAPLFGPRLEPAQTPMGRIVKGLRPGFLAASLEVRPWTTPPLNQIVLPVEVYRYTAANRGWVTLMRTGPSAFGQWFLAKWKKAMGIPFDDRHQASIDGHLVTATGAVYPVATEEECFRVIGIKPLAPEDRGEFMERVRAAREAGRSFR